MKVLTPLAQRVLVYSLRAILVLIAALSLVLGLSTANLFGTSVPSASAASSLPCDLYASNGTPCVAAHSTVRALFSTYDGPLYQIQRASDQQTLDIGLLSTGGYANSAPQVSFCAGTTCTITKIYDQTTNHNDLPISPGGTYSGPGPNGADVGADAMALPVMIAGHQVYGVKVTPGVGYRIAHAQGVATGSQPEGIYMVTSSNLVNSSCCMDYGSGESDSHDDGNSTMNAIYWGAECWVGGCTGSGPWVGGDLENGMYFSTSGTNNPNNPGVHFPFVSAFEKNNGTTNFTLKYGNAQSGSLTTSFSGALPNGYSPMKVQNSILLGTGGDNSDWDQGEFFEGAMTSGYPTDAAENAVQGSIVSSGYTYPTLSPGYTVNAGGAATGSFVADEDYSGGTSYSTTASINTSGVSNPAPQAVYQTERYGNFTYTLPNLIPGAQYTVRLHFAEIYWTSSGQRLFNVSINGQQVLSNFDIYAAAGGADKAIVEQYTATADARGQVAIQFTTVKDNAKVSGIEVNFASLGINAGGSSSGSFAADEFYSSGSLYSTTASINTSGVSNPAPQAVYQTERYGYFTYNIPGLVAGQNYTVRLHFAEIHWTSSGQRLFDVSINGQQVLSNFDIYATAGGANKAVVEQFTATADPNGQIAIQFSTVKDNAKVDGIQVIA